MVHEREPINGFDQPQRASRCIENEYGRCGHPGPKICQVYLHASGHLSGSLSGVGSDLVARAGHPSYISTAVAPHKLRGWARPQISVESAPAQICLGKSSLAGTRGRLTTLVLIRRLDPKPGRAVNAYLTPLNTRMVLDKLICL
jgi:hypothetical protein